MRYWTYLEIKTKIAQDLDLEDETFIQPTELLAYVNEGIDEAEAEIHTLYEDYFLARATLTLVNGTEAYAMPANIYANKTRRLLYRNGSIVGDIPRLPEGKKLQIYTDNLIYNPASPGCYDYFIDNSAVGLPKIILTPTPRESGAYVTHWYLRNANRLLDDGLATDICDIPEFVEFVIQYAKVRCYEKEGHPMLPKALADLEQQRGQMTGTLAQLAADGANSIEADMQHYAEHN